MQTTEPSIVFVAFLFPAIFSTTTWACDLPPDLWCDSIYSAYQCDVVRQCEAFRRTRLPLRVTFIYEALCPYCKRFITNDLGSIYNEFEGRVEFELIPWGNARLFSDGSIVCNHGAVECLANRLQSCVLDTVALKYAIPFIICFERNIDNSGVEGAFNYCLGFVRNHYQVIRRCFESERGFHLQHEAARRTMSVQPHQITEVPYFIINDYSPTTYSNDVNIYSLKHVLKKWLNAIEQR